MTAANLKSILKTARPREIAGSRTVGRYGYQANVGIFKLMELREAGGDFCLVFDYFDDLAVLDSTNEPTVIRLYQVKTKDPGDWTISNLCKMSGKAKPRSILARLYAHSEDFGPFVAETGLISNAAFKVMLTKGGKSSGSHHRIPSADMHASEQAKAIKAVEAEFTPSDTAAWLPKFVLVRAPFGVHDHEHAIKGRLHNYFDKLGIADDINLSAVYDTLHASIESKTGFSQEGLTNSEILGRKSLSNADFLELLDRASKRRRGLLSDWDVISKDLEKEGKGSADVIRLKTCVTRYLQNRQSGQSQSKRVHEDAATWVARHQESVKSCTTITALAAQMQSDIGNPSGFSNQETYAAMIVEAYEAIYATT